ncbi:SOS response associated peptidase (SRAP) [Paraburkholderia caballeronis]|uniref:SOS response-associated peptidase family protein n=1 Tax=Paraburkholderia caballeronis TaxID=416943 RepID=UPI0010669221|nr:SOS response-associated peptidase family protein [Paraburkholderia caballeronis]TDV39501.1 SOS response associated peptidase (SRAP) [Paraburkholderia caballeronis]
MCGRYTRARGAIDYVAPLAVDREPRLPIDDAPPSWNVSPGTSQPVIYPGINVRRVHWGYLPGWAAQNLCASSRRGFLLPSMWTNTQT